MLRPEARLPSYATPGAAALDFSAAIDCPRLIPPRSSALLPTGLAVEVPEGHVLLLFSRSGHGIKRGLRLSNCVGVIDSDYRGEIMVGITNDSYSSQEIERGERIAQGLLICAPRVSVRLCESLSSTERGAGGFGSTGRL